MQKMQPEFEELTGIKVSSEQIPEQQQRVKVAIEFASGHPSFDAINVSLHVDKRLFGRAKWLVDMRPLLKDPSLTSPDYDFADISPAAVATSTQPDGRMDSLPLNPDLWIIYWNKQIFSDAGLSFPKTMDEMLETARKLTDKKKGIYGFIARGLKNANIPVWTSLLWGENQATVNKDDTKLLTDTPAAIWAATLYKNLMRDAAPSGAIGFNWYECQTFFSQGRAAMWLDGVGFSAPLVDPTKSKVVKTVAFSPVPKGPKAQHSASFTNAMAIARESKKRGAAYLYCQWATGKTVEREILKTGSGTPPRLSLYDDQAIVKQSKFGPGWFETVKACQKISRPGLPEIVPVTQFRDVFGVALTNMIGGADPAAQLRKATADFQPVLDKSNRS